jgi:hypothetical protein
LYFVEGNSSSYDVLDIMWSPVLVSAVESISGVRADSCTDGIMMTARRGTNMVGTRCSSHLQKCIFVKGKEKASGKI